MHFHEVVAQAKASALEMGRHIPILLLEGTKQRYVVALGTLPDDPFEKRRMLFAIGHNAARKDELGALVQVYFISEAWVSIIRQGTLPDVRPSQDPQRQEILVISCVNLKEQTKKIAILSYVRNKEGRLTAIKDFGNKGIQFESELLDAFLAGYRS